MTWAVGLLVYQSYLLNIKFGAGMVLVAVIIHCEKIRSITTS